MKKLLSIFLIMFIFQLSISDSLVAYSRTNYKFTISVSNAVCYKSDSEVSVNVFFENVPQIGVACGILKLKYDKTCLSFRGFVEGDIHHEGDSIEVRDYDGNIIVNYINSFSNMAIVRDGKFVQLIFKINNAKVGDYPIELNNKINDFAGIHIDGSGFADYVLLDPQPEFSPGGIKIVTKDEFVTPTPTNTVTPTPSAINTPTNTKAPINAQTQTVTFRNSEPIAVASSTAVPSSTTVATSTPAVILEPSPTAIVAASSVDLVNDVIHIYPGKGKIQDVVNNALPGSTILISKGEYKENIIINNENIKIMAENNDLVSIDASGKQSPVLTLYNSKNIDIRGIMFIGGIRGVQIENSDNIRISDCIVKDNLYEGINMTDSSSDNTIMNCEIYNNTTGVDLGDFNGQDNNTIDSCKIYNNKEFGVKGLTKTTSTKVLKSQVFGNKRVGIFVGGKKWIIENNYIYDNLEAAILVDPEADAIIKDNKISEGAMKISDIKNHWALNDIQNLIDRKIVSGYLDSTIRPDNPITRYEIVTIVVKGLKATPKEKKTDCFNDINALWARDYVSTAFELGFISGYGDNSFRGTNNVTKAEAVVMLLRAAKLKESNTLSCDFIDSRNIPKWATGYYIRAIESGFIKGYADRTLRPNSNITRAEVFTLINKIFYGSETNHGISSMLISSNQAVPFES